MKLRCSKDYLAHCGFPRVTAFDEISSHARGRNGLRDAYRSVDDIEFNVGLFPQDKRPNSVLPRLMGCIVGIESQALTNPLLAARVVTRDAFLPLGCHIIRTTCRVSDILNCDVLPRDLPYGVTMTRSDRQRR